MDNERKDQEKQLSFLGKLLDLVPSAVYYKDRQGVFQACNQAFAELVELPKSQIIGQTLEETWLGKVNTNRMLDEVLFLLQEPQNFELEIVLRSGEKRYVNVHRNVYNDDPEQPEGLIGVMEDIGHRKIIERDLQKSLAVLNSILESSNEGFLAVHTEGEQRSVVAANQRLWELFSVPVEQLASGTDELQEVLQAVRDRTAFQQGLDRLFAGDGGSGFDEVILKNDRTLERYSAPYYIDDKVAGRIFSYRDVTDSKQAAAELRESNERHQSLWDQTSDGIFTCHPDTLQILEANASFSEMIAWPLAEIYSLKIRDFMDFDEEDLRRSINQAVHLGQLYMGVKKCRRRDGVFLNVELKASVITFRQESVIMINVRDITERKRLEDGIMAELQLAAKVQRRLLPPPVSNDLVTIEQIYSPWQGVSGDIFDYHWNPNRTVLTGFILDVSGHGMATALKTSMFLMLAKEVMGLNLSLKEKVYQLNRQLVPWSEDGTFVAAILFEFNFEQMTLRYIPAGIGYLLAAGHWRRTNSQIAEYHPKKGTSGDGNWQSGLIRAPGFMLGFFGGGGI